MTGAFAVRYTDAARDDLLRLFDFLLERANTVEDFAAAQLENGSVVNIVAVRHQIEDDYY